MTPIRSPVTTNSHDEKLRITAAKKKKRTEDNRRYKQEERKRVLENAVRTVKAVGINPTYGFDRHKPKKMSQILIYDTAKQVIAWRNALDIPSTKHVFYHELKTKGEAALKRQEKTLKKQEKIQSKSIAETRTKGVADAVCQRPVTTSKKKTVADSDDESYGEVTSWVDNMSNIEAELTLVNQMNEMKRKHVDYEHKVLEADRQDEEAIVAGENDLIEARLDIVKAKEDVVMEKQAIAKARAAILNDRKVRAEENKRKRDKAMAQLQITVDESNALYGKQHKLTQQLHRLQQGAFLNPRNHGTMATESEARKDRRRAMMETPSMRRDLLPDLDNASMATAAVFDPSVFNHVSHHPIIDLKQHAVVDLGNDDDDEAWSDGLAGSLDRLIIPQLKTILKGMKLPVSGKKSKLIERLVESGRKEEVIQGMDAFVKE